MAKPAETTNAKYTAGIFIVVTLMLLIFSILWLRYFAVRPDMTIIAKFSNPGPLDRGSQVYYQGVNVGKVSKVALTEDYQYTLVYLDFYEKVDLPENVLARVRTEGITGQKFVDITYPENPVQARLTDGDVIFGKSPFGLDEIQDFFEQQIKSGRIERILTSIENTLENANRMSVRLDKMSATAEKLLSDNQDEVNQFLRNSSQAAQDISTITGNARDFLGDPQTEGDLRTTLSAAADAAESIERFVSDEDVSGNLRETVANINQTSLAISKIANDPEIQQGIKGGLSGFNRLLGKTEGVLEGTDFGFKVPEGTGGILTNFNQLLRNANFFVQSLNCYTGQVYKDVEQTNLIENISDAFEKASTTFDSVDKTFGKTGQVLDQIDPNNMDGNIINLIVDTIGNFNQTTKQVNQTAKEVEVTAQRFDCVGEGLSDMLSKRFLLFKLLFGKPGAELEECKNGNITSNNLNQPCPAKSTPCPKKQNRTNQELESIPPAPCPVPK